MGRDLEDNRIECYGRRFVFPDFVLSALFVYRII